MCPSNTSESSLLTSSWCDYCNASQYDHPIVLPNPNYTCSFTTVVDLCTLDDGLLANETFCVNADLNSTTATVTTTDLLLGHTLLNILQIEEIGESKVYRVLWHQAVVYLGAYVLLCVLLSRKENHRLFAKKKKQKLKKWKSTEWKDVIFVVDFIWIVVDVFELLYRHIDFLYIDFEWFLLIAYIYILFYRIIRLLLLLVIGFFSYSMTILCTYRCYCNVAIWLYIFNSTVEYAWEEGAIARLGVFFIMVNDYDMNWLVEAMLYCCCCLIISSTFS